MRTTTRTPIIAMLAMIPLLATLGGCAAIVPLEPADDAANPTCADVIVRLPDTVAGLDKRETNAQGTGAWGTPANILLRCGVAVPDPTAELACVTAPEDGIDWLRDDSDAPNYVFTSYGRDPAVQVIIDSDGDPDIDGDEVSGFDALSQLAGAVSQVPADRFCVGLSDTPAPDDTADSGDDESE
ncbi:DUF3515 family protein [Salinibacterium sp. NSLL150]|uniref:DUF3515 family protein n=1 Tax=unclassified Salinibacterium TaxID=2632331 RepID=UPI0018CE2074|nr:MULTISPECIES: DUF3515 family protein [unclassified Salinibacterium]MBH0023670.1 DUF3515 family protein [Salinibacterium sp. SWN248]MBH0098631.1 DUF3515 family protein [Salinibacterium sp. NSLL35]MBH0101386.1 DUF3515 family protein [Salinibacterium sp. NSLL150]MBH0104145.1 DUF3515 family protein [Salinibacterium sp. NSLL16]MBH0106906.1 DUF3515 family protein [Salinibacterium sp. NSLL17]